jgi:hypothetical protein
MLNASIHAFMLGPLVASFAGIQYRGSVLASRFAPLFCLFIVWGSTTTAQ